MLNLTPHEIVIRTEAMDVIIPPSGTVARVAMVEKAAAPCTIAHVTMVEMPTRTRTITDIEAPVITRAPGEVVGMPTPDEIAAEGGAIVSAMVLAAVPGMPGVYAPDTGATAVRDDAGRIVAVTRLVAA